MNGPVGLNKRHPSCLSRLGRLILFAARRLGFQHDYLAAAGDVDGQPLAACLPRQHVGLGNVLLGGALGEVAGLGDAVVGERLDGGLHQHMFLGRDVAADDKGMAQALGQICQVLARAIGGHVLLDVRLLVLTQGSGVERLLEERAGVIQLDVAIAVLKVANVPERKHRLAAIAFAAHHGGNGAGRRHGGLGSVAQAVLLDAADNRRPVELRALPVARIRLERRRRLPLHAAQLLRVIDAVGEGQERAALLGQLDALLHAVVTHKLHDLGGKLLALLRCRSECPGDTSGRPTP